MNPDQSGVVRDDLVVKRSSGPSSDFHLTKLSFYSHYKRDHMKYFIRIFLLSALSFSAYADTSGLQNNQNIESEALAQKHGVLKDLKFKYSYGLKEEPLKKSINNEFELGLKQEGFNLTKNINLTIAGKLYYKLNETQLSTEKNKSAAIGVGLARLDYNKWSANNDKDGDGITPYLMLNIENINSESTNNTGATTQKLSSVYVWGLGVEFKINSALTFDISHSIKTDQLTSQKLLNETSAKISVDLLKLTPK